MTNRRQFIKAGTIASTGLLAPWVAGIPNAYAFSQSDNLRKFIQPLRRAGAINGIPLSHQDTARRQWWQPGVDHYTIDIGQFEDQLHPDLPNPTRLWGYGQGFSGNNSGWTKHLGGIIVAHRGTPVQVTFRNNLPAKHIIPVDTTVMGAIGAANRTSVHLHGGFTPWVSDGGPNAWWDPKGNQGPSFVNVLNRTAARNEAEYFYTNNQSARMMWYHDHALGTTRVNAYAGLASGFILTDAYETSLASTSSLPGPLDARTMYLIFQDKTFVSKNIAEIDPTWPALMPNARAGDLWYPHVYEAARWELASGGNPPHPSAVPEFFGDTILVNGTVYPFLEIEPRQYRLRLLNASNARFLNPRLVYAKGTGFPDNTEPNPNVAGPAFIQIGTEGGFLPNPTMVNGPKQPQLLLAPAERADLIVDFRDVPAGTTLILYNDAPAPFPNGDPRYDHHPSNQKTPASISGYGPNTRTLLQIRVKALSGLPDLPITLPTALAPTDQFLVTQAVGVPTAIPPNAQVRYLTLNEAFDAFGRLIQYLGTNTPINPGAKNLQFGRGYTAAPTEIIAGGSLEVWEIANLTADTHPIHFHLVNGQILSRQRFSDQTYPRGTNIPIGGMPITNYLGQPTAPEPNELGWKETIRMNPGEVTRVLMKFDLPTVPFTVPLSTTTSVAGHEYVWHCHILEHEEHDMMRPIIIT
jgi:spore coat protein A, manganese oxidase